MKNKYNKITLTRRDQLTWNIFFLVFFFGVISFLVLGGNMYKNNVNDGTNKMKLRAEKISLEVENYFAARFTILDYLANRPELKTMDFDAQKDFLREASKESMFEYFFVVDAEGFGHYYNEGVVRDQHEEQFFKDIMDNEHFVTDPFLPMNGTPITTLCTHVYNEEGEIVGALCGVVKLKDMYEEVLQQKSKDSVLVVFSKGGRYITSEDMIHVSKGDKIQEVYKDSKRGVEFIEKGLDTNESITTILRYEGQDYCLCITDVEDCHWKIGMAMRTRDLLHDLNKVIMVVLFLLLEVGIFVCFLRYMRRKALISEQRTYIDRLTGLNNAARCHQVMELFQENTKEDIMMICFDLNHFKQINDTLGHQVGDEALVDFAECIERSFGEKGFVGRMGGDEFIALLSGNVQEKYEDALKNMHELIDGKNQRADKKYELSVAYGCGVRHKEDALNQDKNISMLYKEADKNMYICKEMIKGAKKQ